MNVEWLLSNSNIPIKYIITKDNEYCEQLLQNNEVQYWLSQLKLRSENKDISNIHGSHDYRIENILGKCSILGLSNSIPLFSHFLEFILIFLDRHISEENHDELSFGKIYSYRDFETVLACFLPMLGYSNEPSVKYITEKRIQLLYSFTKQKRYDIFVDGSKLQGVKKEWQPFVINPDLYSDGNISLPTMHDFILFAGMYKEINTDNKNKVDSIVEWVFDDRYTDINRRYGYFYVPGGTYNVKAVIFKMHLVNFKNALFEIDDDLSGIIFTCFILSHFQLAKQSEWFLLATSYLNKFMTSDNRFIFPRNMIVEKPDTYVTNGGHMNVGEDKRAKNYNEVISTYWMTRVKNNIAF